MLPDWRILENDYNCYTNNYYYLYCLEFEEEEYNELLYFYCYINCDLANNDILYQSNYIILILLLLLLILLFIIVNCYSYSLYLLFTILLFIIIVIIY